VRTSKLICIESCRSSFWMMVLGISSLYTRRFGDPTISSSCGKSNRDFPTGPRTYTISISRGNWVVTSPWRQRQDLRNVDNTAYIFEGIITTTEIDKSAASKPMQCKRVRTVWSECVRGQSCWSHLYSVILDERKAAEGSRLQRPCKRVRLNNSKVNVP
jgi:hypothetical protein